MNYRKIASGALFALTVGAVVSLAFIPSQHERASSKEVVIDMPHEITVPSPYGWNTTIPLDHDG